MGADLLPLFCVSITLRGDRVPLRVFDQHFAPLGVDLRNSLFRAGLVDGDRECLWLTDAGREAARNAERSFDAGEA